MTRFWSELVDDRLHAEVSQHPCPLLFATISGAHLYGFPSPDSDFDLRGAHILPMRDVVGLDAGRETVETSYKDDVIEMDLVTHDLFKFFHLMLRKNGYVLEQVLSPLVIHSTPEHEELKALSRGCVTRYHNHHYRGFAETQWRLFEKESPRRIKPLLYVYRVLLTGIHLMRTGEVEANLVRLNESARLSHVADLVAAKTQAAEKSTLSEDDFAFHSREYSRLQSELEESHRASSLPEVASTKPALNELLVRLRLKSHVS